ncbi:hypothetical protein HFP70_35840 [Streptomyces sp. ARC14]|uniref:hypothetical protein n=1 Tax=Streptomyces sp. ARC14 TaxID=2724152 RepID=UPI00385732F3
MNTPDGLGEVMAVNGDSILVRAERGTRVHALKDVTRTDGTPFGGSSADASKERQNAERIAQASTPEGTDLGDGRRLRDLDMEAGHGTIVGRDGNTIGWVRARIGDNGRRYWWGRTPTGETPATCSGTRSCPPRLVPLRSARPRSSVTGSTPSA